MSNSIIAQRSIDGDNGHSLLEASVGSYHPFGSRFGKDDNVLAWFLAKFSQTAPEISRRALRLGERLPLVVTEVVLLEDSTVLLHLILLAEDLPGAQTTLRRVSFGHIVEYLLQGIDILLQHLHVDIPWWIRGPVGQLIVIVPHDLCLENERIRGD